MPGRFQTVGAYILGRAPLRLRIGKLAVLVRPGSEDLAILLMAHEPEVADWFHPNPGELVVDVGANVGCYSLRAAAAGARVIALEPNPENHRLLLENLRLNGFENFVAIESGAGETTGTALLTTPTIFTGRASTNRAQAGSLARIEIKPLDELVGVDNLDRVDWLKIDVEGAELSVLKGARRTLARTLNIIIEVSHATSSECKTLLVDVAGFRILRSFPDVGFDYWLLTKTLET